MVESLVIPFVVVVRDELAPGRPEERVAVMEEDPEVSQASVLGLGGVPHELGDPHSPSPWAASNSCQVVRVLRSGAGG